MFSYLIKDGNLKEWVRILLVVGGIGFVALGVMMNISSFWGSIFFLLGFLIAAIGGYAAQAHMLKVKPFDNSYEKTKESYNKDEDHQ